jgi:hypothetical protein
MSTVTMHVHLNIMSTKSTGRLLVTFKATWQPTNVVVKRFQFGVIMDIGVVTDLLGFHHRTVLSQVLSESQFTRRIALAPLGE